MSEKTLLDILIFAIFLVIFKRLLDEGISFLLRAKKKSFPHAVPLKGCEYRL